VEEFAKSITSDSNPLVIANDSMEEVIAGVASALGVTASYVKSVHLGHNKSRRVSAALQSALSKITPPAEEGS
jgi:hypothetical protein